MRFASLGSGSEGNALIVECGPPDAPVRLLIDCGFGVREARRRLERLGVDAASLDALLVTIWLLAITTMVFVKYAPMLV